MALNNHISVLNCYRVLLVLTAHSIAAQDSNQEVTFESLNEGPGLLPFRLGTTRLIRHYHTFLQYVQLKDIEEEINLLHSQLTDYKFKLSNNTHSLFEIQIEYLAAKLTKVTGHLDTLKSKRIKRGLIDGFGSVIKSLTGNLDYSDAIKYDNAIKILQNNDDQIIQELNNHISLSKEWMSQHSNIVNKLTENQVNINKTLQLILDRQAYKDYSLIKYAKFAQYLTIVTENIDEVLGELIRIENILAFIHTSSPYHSMISIEVLDSMIHRLIKIYGKDQVLDLDLREYYDLIKPGYYYSGSQIVIIFKIPIFTVDIYELYKLAIAPNKFKQALIPPFPLIATNKNDYVYMEAECPKYNNWYLCEEKMDHHLRKTPDCVQHLLTDQYLGNNCELTTVTLSKGAMDQLDDRHYVLSFPNLTKIHTVCGKENFNLINGSYLVTIPINCFLYANEFTIANVNDRIEGRPIKIFTIPHEDNQQEEIMNVNLNSMDLRKLHEIQHKISMQPLIHIEKTHSKQVLQMTIPLYVILLGALILMGFILMRKYKTLIKCQRPKEDNEDKQCEIEESSSRKPDSAIFSQLKARK
ncbi:hypothetical protein K1T71_003697 [Dendrolimus kikuchii]|uniref:Uncharacterized protein n=1 Tax=Dendrolimus kikuchii TaxID=765133 RepID=A0ACC1D8M9_9NEOP|nr:hypothetical protein K1T71_003697 [Dendrolimus kikuchii]